jgi:adenylate cyclase
MGIEIERKFLVKEELWRPTFPRLDITQGYLSTDIERVVRVRVAQLWPHTNGYLTIKGKGGHKRSEYEYSIPLNEAMEMLLMCLPCLVEKSRYTEIFHEKTWYVDVFQGYNAGLFLAEIETKTEDELFDLPPWLGKEVTDDPKYANANLATNPYKNW